MATPRRARTWVRILRSSGLTVAIVFLLLAGLAMGFGDNFIFFPTREGDWEAAKHADFPIQDVALSASDGTKLHAWHVRAKEPRATVLYFHGNAGNIAGRRDIAESLAALGCDVFLSEYRGYGKCEGKPTEKGITLDAEAAYDHLTRTLGVPPSKLILYGESLGSGSVIELATRHPCAGVVLQCPFTSIRDMAGRVVPLFPAHWFMASKFDNIGRIPSVKVPKLFLATRQDEVVPYKLTKRLYEAAPEPKTWVEFQGIGHNDIPSLKRRDWMEAVSKFVDATVGEASGAK